MPIFRGRKPTKKKTFGGKPGKPQGRGGKPGGKFGKFGKPGGGSGGGGAGGAGGGKKGKNRGAPKRKKKIVKKAPAPSLESTGMEALYLKDLMETETPVIVVLNTGEKVRGYVRYYDQEVFSLGPADGSPKMFLRKEGIRYLYEEPEEEEEFEEDDEEDDDEEDDDEERD